jgi:hypothetical protein
MPFLLPTPNPPHAPPEGDTMVAIWHEMHGLIRGRRIGNSWYRLMSRSRVAERLEPHEVLGWWPDPKPYPDQIIRCATCDNEIHIPVVRHEPDGRIGPAYRSVPDGWQLKPASLQARLPFGTVWSCPANHDRIRERTVRRHPSGDVGVAGRVERRLVVRHLGHARHTGRDRLPPSLGVTRWWLRRHARKHTIGRDTC